MIFFSIASMSCGPLTPNQWQIVLLNWRNETHHFLLYFSVSSILYITVFCRLPKHNFANQCGFIKILNTIDKTTHPNCKIPHTSDIQHYQNQTFAPDCKHFYIHITDSCLMNYTLLGIMKSTPIFSMLCHNTNIVQTVENSSDCSHAQNYSFFQ